jgi:hypothetical protein
MRTIATKVVLDFQPFDRTCSDLFMISVRRFPKMLEVNYRINESLAWGLGWEIKTTSNGTAFWHSGDNGTFQCVAFLT